MKHTIKWIVLFALLCLVCLGVIALRAAHTKTQQTACLVQDGKVLQVIDLQKVDTPYEFDVFSADGGRNRIRVERGRIAVVDADCPDKICVHQGYIDTGAVPIVCLPHKLSVSISAAKAGLDATTGGAKQ